MKNKNTPTIIVIFGITGDLAAKKIIPSLWHLFHSGSLPDKLSVIGFSRRDISNPEFYALVCDAVTKRGGGEVTEKNLSEFYSLFSYHSGNFNEVQSFQSLLSRIAETENSWGMCANKLFYLSVPPSSFGSIFKNLAAVGLNLPCGGDVGWSRVLVEKPFGSNLAGAKELQALLSSYFKEEQIYRIDHYLFKEIIQGIKNFRFSNNLFENIWDNTTIERIDIRLLESIGVEERGSFYDSVGALRDVGGNHILNMLAALTMEYPKSSKAEHIQKSRADILGELIPWTTEAIKRDVYRAQYVGYKKIKGVRENSETETYFSLKTELSHPKWRGIPIFMEAGKRMSESRKEMILTLKHPVKCLLCEKGPHAPNRIVFRLEPNDEIVIHFWSKKPGYEQILEERTFSFFLYEKETRIQYVEEYKKILHAAMFGIRELFVSQEEVEAYWRFTDPVEMAWESNLVPLYEYEPETTPMPKILEVNKNISVEGDKYVTGEIGIIGLGKMGANLARQLYSKNWRVVGFNRSKEPVDEIINEGLQGTYSLNEMVQKLTKPRTVWLMVPHQAVDTVLDELIPLLEPGDTIIEGGNSPYKETICRGEKIEIKGINFLDVGVSGGPEGALHGACIMVGGRKDLYDRYKNLFKTISVENGYGYMGKSGAGHFVKMVHNGIEYGMMQAIGEGFEVLKKSPFNLDLESVAELYNHGSVITSRLVGWLVRAYEKFSNELNDEECCSGRVSHSGEGQWTVDTAREFDVPVTIIEGALEFRKQSQANPTYSGQVVSALRHEFGGHNTSNKKI